MQVSDYPWFPDLSARPSELVNLLQTDSRDAQEDKMADLKIVVRSSGPLRVYEPFEMEDADGKTFTLPEGQWVSLCRCGASKNKPFCDGAHRDIGFEADTKAT